MDGLAESLKSSENEVTRLVSAFSGPGLEMSNQSRDIFTKYLNSEKSDFVFIFLNCPDYPYKRKTMNLPLVRVGKDVKYYESDVFTFGGDINDGLPLVGKGMVDKLSKPLRDLLQNGSVTIIHAFADQEATDPDVLATQNFGYGKGYQASRREKHKEFLRRVDLSAVALVDHTGRQFPHDNLIVQSEYMTKHLTTEDAKRKALITPISPTDIERLVLAREDLILRMYPERRELSDLGVWRKDFVEHRVVTDIRQHYAIGYSVAQMLQEGLQPILVAMSHSALIDCLNPVKDVHVPTIRVASSY